ncbi:MAG: type II secretion system protein, partial [Betaproteobacteria bacterium]|nr:type II secretion system protein [Betaproteobacteria bacterium]
MCIRRDMARRLPPRGFTLVELIVFIVVVGAGLAGVLSVLNLTAQKSADPMLTKQAIAVAEAFMNEILAREFSNADGYVGAASQEGRKNFADVDDYNGYPSDLPAGGIYAYATPASGSPIGGLSKYSVAISVQATASAIGPGAEVPAGAMKRITVTVTDP